MMSLPRFPLSQENWNATVSDGVAPLAKPAWSGYPPPNNDDPLVGQTLNGTYVVEFVLGEGGMGRVYRAHHTRIANKRFAIKVLRQELSSNREMVARFQREAETAASVVHPNVIEVFDVDETRSHCCYLVCEYLEGIELSEHLKACARIDIQTAIHIARQVCQGLAAAHAAGVMHRDIKPQNIFVLTEPGAKVPARPSVKLLDFGLSRFMDSVGTQLTQDGVIMGTPAYMAPEQASGGAGAVDYRADIYGVGAVLYTLITGKPPHEGETLQELLVAVLNEAPPLPRTINPEIPANLELVLQRAMSRNPDERYQCMQELDEALAMFAEPSSNATRAGLQARPLGFNTQPDAWEVRSARPRLIALGALAVLLMLIGIGSTFPSVELLTGKLHLTRIELTLILSSLIATLITPIWLFIGYLRKNVWASHVRVLDHLRTIELALLWGLAGYGAAALVVRFLDDVAARFGAAYLFGRSPGANFGGWNALFLTIALVVSGMTVFYRRFSRPVHGRRDRLWRVAIAVAGSLVVFGGVALGMAWRLQVARAEQARQLVAAASKPASEPVAVKQAPSAAPEPAPAVSATREKPIERAPADELAAASAKGAQGLAPLAERYPRDPNVLKPLVLAYASRSTGLTDAMAVLQRLFDAAPEETRDNDLRFLVRRAANAPGEASIIAFSIMLEHMGSAGPDQLYEIMISNPRLSKRVDEMLASREVQAIATPALRVAYDLRKAPGCAARLPLLDRAAELGDLRTVALLSPLTVGTKKGCGRWKRSPCPAPCAAETRQYLGAISRIMARQPRR